MPLFTGLQDALSVGVWMAGLLTPPSRGIHAQLCKCPRERKDTKKKTSEFSPRGLPLISGRG